LRTIILGSNKKSGAKTEEIIDDPEQDGYGNGILYKE